ncbi:MAG: hypothetical protein ACI9NC_005549 [Verrucomicrobiales bacterium]|jgi:hypothetical protein
MMARAADWYLAQDHLRRTAHRRSQRQKWKSENAPYGHLVSLPACCSGLSASPEISYKKGLRAPKKC